MQLCFIIIWKEGKGLRTNDTYFKALGGEKNNVEDPQALIPYVKKSP